MEESTGISTGICGAREGQLAGGEGVRPICACIAAVGAAGGGSRAAAGGRRPGEARRIAPRGSRLRVVAAMGSLTRESSRPRNSNPLTVSNTSISQVYPHTVPPLLLTTSSTSCGITAPCFSPSVTNSSQTLDIRLLNCLPGHIEETLIHSRVHIHHPQPPQRSHSPPQRPAISTIQPRHQVQGQRAQHGFELVCIAPDGEE